MKVLTPAIHSPYGGITTEYQVTRKLRETMEKLEDAHENRFGTRQCSALCNYALSDRKDVCNMIAMIYGDIKKAAFDISNPNVFITEIEVDDEEGVVV